jgi:D-3-phosphoglycerate dehydrogenase
MAAIFLTHPPEALANDYGERIVTGLKALGCLRFSTAGRELSAAELFRASPELVAFSRCAIDIGNVDVAAASAAGILVTQASAGFVASVSEWVIGAMIDLGRNLTASTLTYRAGAAPRAPMGRRLEGSTLGSLGYGRIGRRLADLALALKMRYWYTTPARPREPRVRAARTAAGAGGVGLCRMPRGRQR